MTARTARVLVVDPNPGARETLGAAGLRTTVASEGHRALKLFYSEQSDAVVLALELSGLSGWEVLLKNLGGLLEVPTLPAALGTFECT